MYLSKIKLDLRSVSVQQALRDCGDMHRNIQKLFMSSRSDASVLYRVCHNNTGCYVYMMSEQEPISSKETTKNGMQIMQSRDVSALEDIFEPGKKLCFNILTMPYKKVSDGIGKNSRRKFLQLPEERLNWLNRKAEQNGFEILNAEEQKSDTLVCCKKDAMIYIPSVMYDGVLRIIDKEKFVKAWRNGIGAEKAYGLGMMLLR